MNKKKREVSHEQEEQAEVRHHILLVDDDRLILSTLAKGIREEGYAVHIAADGAEALACVKQRGERIDLAIVDIALPDISGTELAQTLAEDYGIPVLFLSAYSSNDVVRKAVMSGGIGYMVKPVDEVHLLPAIETAVARARDFSSLFRNKQQLEKALHGNREINICVGILMERENLSAAEAFETLRFAARSSQDKIEKVARRLIESEELLNTVRPRNKMRPRNP